MAIRDALVEGPRFSMADITALAASIADWCPHPSIRIFLFGSRVRGDHHDGSDVDVAVEITDPGDQAAVDWWFVQDGAEFRAQPPRDLPGPLCVIRAHDDSERWLWEKLIAAEPLHRDRNVTCVILPPTPPEERVAQEERRQPAGLIDPRLGLHHTAA